jgi:hypothetical protein
LRAGFVAGDFGFAGLGADRVDFAGFVLDRVAFLATRLRGVGVSEDDDLAMLPA